MAKLLSRYLGFVVAILLVSGVSLLLWLHEDKWRSHARFNSIKSVQMIYAEKLKAALQLHNQPNSISGSDHEFYYENGRFPHLNTKRPKVYIYTLAPRFNTDIYNCLHVENDKIHSCFSLHNNGFGTLLYKEGEMEVYDTNQFSLEVIMHYQLMNSEYLTDNPAEADVFYIPSYLGSMFFCSNLKKSLVSLHEELFKHINSLPYFKSGKPHLSTLAKIEREMAGKGYPLLQNPNTKNVTYIMIEKEARRSSQTLLGISDLSVIVAPYPSYVHRNDNEAVSQTISSPSLQSRNIFLFLAASSRRSNSFRAILLDQFENRVKRESYHQYLEKRGLSEPPNQIMLLTPECSYSHINITIQWMQKSVFCLQPPGDSPTRKSFYDCVQSGCIPVIFNFPSEVVEYPFQSVLNYTEFTVVIEYSRITETKESVFDILKAIPESKIASLHDNVLQVARQLQYSKQDRSKPKKFIDALDMIMDQVRKKHHL